MKAFLLIMLVPLLGWAQEIITYPYGGYCTVPGCLVNHSFGTQEHFVPDQDSVLVWAGLDSLMVLPTNQVQENSDPTPEAIKVAESSNAQASADAVFNLWDGLYLGTELYRRFDPPFNTTMGIYGDLRFNLSKELGAGLRIAVPFGNSVTYRLHLEKKLL